MVIAIFLLALAGGMFGGASADITSAERDALIALYNSTDGDNWNDNSGWKEAPLDVDGFAIVIGDVHAERALPMQSLHERPLLFHWRL